MPKVAREGDHGLKGVIEIDESLREHDNLTDGPRTAVMGDFYSCRKKGHKPPPGQQNRLRNGCFFYRPHGRMAAMQYATRATCGCRIMEGSGVHHCCPHLDEKAKRLAEREKLIEAARDLAEEADVTPQEAELLRRRAAGLERLNRDIRFAEQSQAVYQSPDAPEGLTKGFGNAPEGMIRLTDDSYREYLPVEMADPTIQWDDKDSGFHADVYYDELFGTHTVAIRGTETHDLKDGQTDFDQAHGKQTRQYDLAMSIGDRISEYRKNNPNTGVEFNATGHSLGGGAGSALGTVAGISYITFNAAGLHPITVSRYTEGKLTNADGAHLGVNYSTDHDPLTLAQTPEGSAWLYDKAEATGDVLTGVGTVWRNPLGKLLRVAGSKMDDFVDWSRQQTGGQLPASAAATQYELSTTVQDEETGDYEYKSGVVGVLNGHQIGTVIDSIELEKIGHQGALRRLMRRIDCRRNGPLSDWALGSPK